MAFDTRMYDRYAKLRDKAGVTDYAVAKATEINPVVFSQWRWKSNPKVDKLQKIARYFGVSIEDLIGE